MQLNLVYPAIDFQSKLKIAVLYCVYVDAAS